MIQNLSCLDKKTEKILNLFYDLVDWNRDEKNWKVIPNLKTVNFINYVVKEF